jgi:ribonuclease HI
VVDWTPPPCHLGGPYDNEPEVKALVFIEPHWILFFDGSSRKQGFRTVVLLLTAEGEQFKYMVHINFNATNNMAEFEVLIFGLSTTLSLRVQQLLANGDSQLIIKKVKGK